MARKYMITTRRWARVYLETTERKVSANGAALLETTAAAGGWAHTVNTVTSPGIVNTVANANIGVIDTIAV